MRSASELIMHLNDFDLALNCFNGEPLIHSFIETISIAPLQVHCYSEALLTQHRYCVGVHVSIKAFEVAIF